MRHRRGNKHLKRTSQHVRSMVRNMVVSVLRYQRVKTTAAKAKVVRRWVDKMITLGKKGTLQARREALAFLRSKKAVVQLFRTIGPRYAARNGGYTRIVKLAGAVRPADSDKISGLKVPAGTRIGDGTALAVLELVEAEVAGRVLTRRPAPRPFRPRREEYRQRREETEASEEAEGDGTAGSPEAPEGPGADRPPEAE